MKINKIKAYTILELTIAMLISAIVIGIAFSSYTILNKLYHVFNSKNKSITEFSLTNKILRKDFLQAKRIMKTESGIQTIDDKGIVSYRFLKDYILRNQYDIRTDTLRLLNEYVVCSFENREASIGDIVDRLNFSTKIDNQVIMLDFIKEYSSEDLINLKEEGKE
ncbi:PulJ/GspJ family protein [Rubrolithibacter danxiaensis]|uniref:PulJ/GspJ family protein n=1 Tax=Rubrolithibacter danxiaensis TaxID=3390805 RepID=UPI003BF81700